MRWTLQRIRLNSQGYDSNWSYYGIGEPLYWACCEHKVWNEYKQMHFVPLLERQQNNMY